MIKKLLLTITATVFMIVACGTNSGTEWALVWEDNFETIDTTVWSKISRGDSDWRRHMSDFDSLYDVKDGFLIVRGMRNDSQKQDTAKFLTGGIYTKGKKDFSQGRIEVRAKFDCAQGFWPAIWMMPSQEKGWPMGGEIDIMEHLNYDTIVYQTLHSNYTLNHHMTSNPKSGIVHPIDVKGFNVYAVELGNDTVKLFVNDVLTNAYPRIETDIEGQFPFSDSPFYLKIDAQLGGTWVGKVDPNQLPAEMVVDWVKFYQKKK